MVATTKIWPIRDNEGKQMGSVSGKINLVLEYVEDEDKTKGWKYRLKNNLSDLYTNDESESMADVIDYAMNEEKTVVEEVRYVTGVNVSVSTAREEMCATKTYWKKEDKILLWHAYQSFKAGEVTPEEAHKIGVELARNLWGEEYEVIVATHTNTDNIHNHFVINSVSFKTGKKLDAKWQDLRRESDRLCAKYGKDVIKNPQYKAKSYQSWVGENKRNWTTAIREDIDEAVLMSVDTSDFLKNMSERGYSIKYGVKYFTLKPPGKERYVRIDRRLGYEYSLSGISGRIKDNLENHALMAASEVQAKRLHVKNRPGRPAHKIGGFQGLYYYYCYQFGVFNNRKHISAAKMHYLYREELMRMEAIKKEARFLRRADINNMAELDLYATDLKKHMTQLCDIRTGRRNELRRAETEERANELKEELKLLNKNIGRLREEQLMCEDIRKNTEAMRDKKRTAERTWVGSVEKTETKYERKKEDEAR